LSRPATDLPDLPPERRELVVRVLADSALRTEQALRNYLDELADAPARLKEAMGYSLFAGGKRLRPGLVFAAGRMLGAGDEALMAPAAAIECVHTFSLIHDDLPSMDDDDLRRGKPTSHKVFGEAMAILAGDALLALAFELLTRGTARAEMPAMVRELAAATGASGMIGGQVADIEGEHQQPTEANVRYIHERKTGALIAAACRMGAIAAGGCDADLSALGHYGYHLGLAFQLADDALDATATAEQLGKRAGKDTQAGKQTMVRLAGLEATMRAARREVAQAVAALEPYGEAAEPLRALAEFVIARSS
jgi:geranylgeranyl diphosphate synthase, type II